MALRGRTARLKRAVGDLYLVMDRIDQTTNVCERATLFRSLHATTDALREVRTACASPEASLELV